jgi:hypothetical protein
VTGGCLCGAVRFEVEGPLRGVVLCHCTMCLKTHGHIAAYSAAPKKALRLTQSRGLKWYASSDFARRGFCGECGGSIFWERHGAETVSIAAGMLDAPTGLAILRQLHPQSASDYYEVDPRIP